jgi:hypothetical protein
MHLSPLGGDEWLTELLKAEDVIPSHIACPATVPGAKVAFRINTHAGSDNTQRYSRRTVVSVSSGAVITPLKTRTRTRSVL